MEVALGALLGEQETLNFLAQHARALIVDGAAVAAIELTDPDPSSTARLHVTVEPRQELAVSAR